MQTALPQITKFRMQPWISTLFKCVFVDLSSVQTYEPRSCPISKLKKKTFGYKNKISDIRLGLGDIEKKKRGHQ